MWTAALAACGSDPGGSCPQPKPIDYRCAGTYTSPGGSPIDWFCTSGCGTVFQPHDGVTNLELTIDHDHARVVIKYTRNGKAIEERWRIAKRSSR